MELDRCVSFTACTRIVSSSLATLFPLIGNFEDYGVLLHALIHYRIYQAGWLTVPSSLTGVRSTATAAFRLQVYKLNPHLTQ